MIAELLRKNKLKVESIMFASDPVTLGIKVAIRGLFFDFFN